MQRFQDKQGLLILGFVRLGHALQHRVYEVGQDDSEHTVPVLVRFHAYFSCSAALAVGLVWGLDLPRHVEDESNAAFGRLTAANIHYLLELQHLVSILAWHSAILFCMLSEF